MTLISVALLVCGVGEMAAQQMYREAPRRFGQEIEIAPGKMLKPQSLPLPQRRTLDFTVKGLPVDTTVDPVEARNRLIKRVQNANDKVMSCLGLADGKPTRSTEEILRLLREEAAKASGELADDLNNMLIAGLASLEVSEKSGAKATFKTWSYRQINDATALCGPTIIAHPDSTLLIPVLNLMDARDLALSGFPVQPTVPLSGADMVNTPHGFDICNLHTHGLCVSPSWPADDVFREIHPYQLKFFVYHLHGDHPVGTFWYHPHKHGAVGPQVASGMAGALLVKGTDDAPLGLDLLAKDKKWGEEDPLILQQLTAYQPLVPENGPHVFRPDFFALKFLISDDNLTRVGSVGFLATWMKKNLAQVQPHIRTLMSGQYHPSLQRRKTGETFRLRLVHGGIEELWKFAITKLDGEVPAAEQPEAGKISIQVIAWDGLVLEEPYMVTKEHALTLAPGNRAEVLVHFAAGMEGEYGIGNATAEGQEDVAHLKVEAGEGGDFNSLTKDEVLTWKLFKPAPTGPVGERVDFEVKIEEKTVADVGNGVYEVDPGEYYVNGSTYPGTPKRFRVNESASLRLGGAQGSGTHPIHIHVNPILLSPSEDRRKMGMPTGRYWTDTVLVKNAGFAGVMPFEYWDGRTVVHCHILDHEDSGMMNALQIRPARLPVAPLPGVFDLTSLKKGLLDLMKPVWPKVAPSSGIPSGTVTVLVFLPRSRGAAQCAHCVAAVQSIDELRKIPNAPEFRIVAVTGPNETGAAELAEALNLDPKRDVLCVDPALLAFQAIGLIDGVPVRESVTGLFTFPQSFGSDGAILHDGDVMHGLFILDGQGFVASSNRSFVAFDDMEQVLAEVKLATGIAMELAKEDDRLKKLTTPNSDATPKIKRATLNLQRQQARYSEFEKSTK
jgi:FtsP/CotA-like multicopper oxidase with cupredoxin domain